MLQKAEQARDIIDDSSFSCSWKFCHPDLVLRNMLRKFELTESNPRALPVIPEHALDRCQMGRRRQAILPVLRFWWEIDVAVEHMPNRCCLYNQRIDICYVRAFPQTLES
jgi:hypothetical protein